MSDKSNKRKFPPFLREILILSVLTLSLIVMFTQYCLLKNSGNYGGLPLLDAMHGNFPEYSETGAEKKTSFLTPSFIGILSDGKKRMPTDAETRKALVREARPYVLALLNGNASQPGFSSESAKSAYIERELYGSDNAIYIAFSDEIPAAAICPILTGKSFGGKSLSYSVRELFLFCDEPGSISGAALDGNGVLTVLTVPERVSLTFEAFSAYAGNENMTNFSFARAENGTLHYPVADTSVTYPNIAAYTAGGEFLSQNAKDSENVLESFAFNPNGTRYYVTRNAYITYVEDIGELRLFAAGDIAYTATNGDGIPLSSLCERQTADGSFEDKICAAYHVLHGLDSAFYGGCADFCLTSVSYRDGKLTLIFSYAVNGVIIDDAREAAVFVFSDKALVSANVLCRTYMFPGSTFCDIPQRLLFAVTYEDAADKTAPTAFFPIYTRNDPDEVYTARYAFTFERRGENESENESVPKGENAS